jgi:hypothetical protein
MVQVVELALRKNAQTGDVDDPEGQELVPELQEVGSE